MCASGQKKTVTKQQQQQTIIFAQPLSVLFILSPCKGVTQYLCGGITVSLVSTCLDDVGRSLQPPLRKKALLCTETEGERLRHLFFAIDGRRLLEMKHREKKETIASKAFALLILSIDVARAAVRRLELIFGRGTSPIESFDQLLSHCNGAVSVVYY